MGVTTNADPLPVTATTLSIPIGSGCRRRDTYGFAEPVPCHRERGLAA